MFFEKAEPRSRRGQGLTAFQRLEAQARRLEASIFLLVALIAVAPPLFLTIVELRHLRARASAHAQQVATILELYAKMPLGSTEGLRRHLRNEFERDDLATLTLFGADGAELVSFGDPPDGIPDSIEFRLPPSAGPYDRLRVRARDHTLRPDIPRIIAIHLLVGLVLGLGIYRIPVQAFGRAIAELKSAQAQLVHADRLSALGSMYAGLTHEINNPLGILSARVKLAMAALEKGPSEDLGKDLEVIDRQTTRIAGIIRSLLAFSRKAEFQMRTVDVNAVVREVLSLVEGPLAKQGVLLEADLAESLPQVLASPDHLHQVLLNLVTNARDAMPKGGRITVRTEGRGAFVVAEVSDTGHGLAPEVQEHLFEPFFTTKEVGKGTGLGLSVSYGIVSAHGGVLDASNAPGGGAVFRMSLPTT